MGGRRACNLEAALMWRWLRRQWRRQHQDQALDVHKWVDFVHKCQKYNQRELHRLVKGHHFIYGINFSILRIAIFLTHHGPSARHCRHRRQVTTPTADDCHTRLPSALASISSLASSALSGAPSLPLPVDKWVLCLDDGGGICLHTNWRYECSSWI